MIWLTSGTVLVTRQEWGARAPKYTTAFTPTFGTTLHWEGPHMREFSHEACGSFVRGIQDFHMNSRGWGDIAYNAVVCPHGYVFEGRWTGKKSGANGTNIGNNTAYAICYLGGEGNPFTDAGKRAFRDTVQHFDLKGGAGSGVNGHRDWKATACPGQEIYDWLRSGMPVEGPGQPPPTPAPVPDRDPIYGEPILRYGSRGPAVTAWQSMIGVPADGIFGMQTVNATKDFQAKMGLVADGVVGPKTAAAMRDLLAYLAAVEAAKAVPPFPGTMRQGSRGDGVRQAQQRLRDRGWRISVDGVFGPGTETIVRSFQRDKRLLVDGVIGPKTWETLWSSPVT